VGRETILVVDDNRQLAHFIAHTLLPSLGYESYAAFGGKSALEQIHARPPSLILMDLEMPEISGLDLLHLLHEEGQNIPTILFTGHGSEQIAAEAFRLGVQDYLVKPVQAADLEKAISRALTETRLRKETERLTQELKEQVSLLGALSKIGQSLTSTLDLDEVLRRIVEAAVQLSNAEEGFIALLDHPTGQIYLRAARILNEEDIKTIRLPVSDSLISEAMRSRRPVRQSDQLGRSGIKISTDFLVHSLIHVPILSKGHPLGVLSVDNRIRQDVFSAKDENMLASLADFAAVALENAALFQQARHEITERKRIEGALRESEERYALAVKGAHDGLWDLDLKNNRIYLAPRWKEMLGFQDEEIGDAPQEWFNRVHPQDIIKLKADLTTHIRGASAYFENEYRILNKDGVYLWMLCRGLAVRGQDGLATRLAGSQTDISQRKLVEARLHHDAFYDKLTDLPNRSLLMQRLEKDIEYAHKFSDYSFAVLFLDLDHFKDINDSLGHPAGDQLLVEVAAILHSQLKISDTVARLGGDEFVILAEDVRDEAAAISLSENILRELSAPINLELSTVFITTSIGIVLSTLGYDHPEDVLRDADIAMYVAKEHGKATYALFDPPMREKVIQRVSLEADLQQALKKKQLQVAFQPIIDLSDGSLFSLEALVHWNHPRWGMMSASEFVPLAREAGLIGPIDWWVFEEACQIAQMWRQTIPLRFPLRLNINLSSSLIARSRLVEKTREILKKTGFAAENLCLEITENAALANQQATTAILAELRQIGIILQMDNFGIIGSSLLYLKQFGFHKIKIDRAFIHQINDQGENAEIPHMIIALAHELGMQAIAGGIETPAQLDLVCKLGCEFGQGFLFSKAQNAQEITCLLAELADPEKPGKLPWQKYWTA
jgi:diguanylate cyclase (GGDEF)-like protein/PAS domain S-box-containing protein